MQYIIINEKYTKGQKTILDKFNALFGKTFTESSLITEINKIFPYSFWKSSTINKQLVITSDYLNLKLTAKFNKIPYQGYKLIQFEYL